MASTGIQRLDTHFRDHPAGSRPLDADRTRIGAYLSTWRTDRHLTQQAMADYLKMTQRGYSKWELGGFDPRREGMLMLALAHYDCEHTAKRKDTA